MITILSESEYATYLKGGDTRIYDNSVSFSDIVLVQDANGYSIYKNKASGDTGKITGTDILKLFMKHKWNKRG
jgi:hypothetical protein